MAETSPPVESPRPGWPVSPGFLWRAGFIAMALVFIFLFITFLIEDGGAVIFTVLMAWFFALAMAPAVDRLSRHMRRGLATILVMLGLVVFLVLFFAAFGALLVDQIIEIVESLPSLAASALDWFNQTFSTAYTQEEILAQVGLDQAAIQSIATEAAKGIFGFATSLLGGLFGLFTLGLIAFYLSADGPRLRKYIASMLPRGSQSVFLNVWDITADKTGRYVAARVILAAVNSFFSGIVFAVIGLPYWLPLALWTGIVAQFVPTIGTYISIILPVLVGLLSGNPWLGVIVLAYGLIYQQIENLTIEPRISAKAVDVHPAYGFVSVLLGAALFGVAGALLAVPVGAMILALTQTYVKRHAVTEEASVISDDVPESEPESA